MVMCQITCSSWVCDPNHHPDFWIHIRIALQVSETRRITLGQTLRILEPTQPHKRTCRRIRTWLDRPCSRLGFLGNDIRMRRSHTTIDAWLSWWTQWASLSLSKPLVSTFAILTHIVTTNYLLTEQSRNSLVTTLLLIDMYCKVSPIDCLLLQLELTYHQKSSSHVAAAILASITLASSATLTRRDCESFTQDSIFLTAGDQKAISTNTRCEDSSGCMLPVEHNVVAGPSWNEESSQTLLEIITESTGMKFEESRNYTLTQRFNQQKGNGYLTFIPT